MLKGHGGVDDANTFSEFFEESSVLLYAVDLQFVNCHQQILCTADGFAKCSHSVAPPTRPFAWTDLMWIQRTQLWAKLQKLSAASF